MTQSKNMKMVQKKWQTGTNKLISTNDFILQQSQQSRNDGQLGKTSKYRSG